MKHWFAILCWLMGLLFLVVQFMGMGCDQSDDGQVEKRPGKDVRNNRSSHHGFYYYHFTGK